MVLLQQQVSLQAARHALRLLRCSQVICDTACRSSKAKLLLQPPVWVKLLAVLLFDDMHGTLVGSYLTSAVPSCGYMRPP